MSDPCKGLAICKDKSKNLSLTDWIHKSNYISSIQMTYDNHTINININELLIKALQII